MLTIEDANPPPPDDLWAVAAITAAFVLVNALAIGIPFACWLLGV